MRFGIATLSHWGDENRSQADVLQQTVTEMIEAERLGYWSAWTTEHHFGNDPTYLPFGSEDGQFLAYDLVSDPLTFFAYVAGKTTKIRLGTGVLVLHFDNPIRVAERAALLDQLSGGRLELGIGRGGGHLEPLAFQVPENPKENYAKHFEALDVILAAWKGERFSHEGKFFQVPELSVVPKPFQNPHPQVFLSSGNPNSLRYAGEHNLSYASIVGAWGTVGYEEHHKAHETFIEAAEKAGRDTSEPYFPNTLFMYVAESDSEAEEMAEEYLVEYMCHVEGHYERQRYGEAWHPIFNNLAAGPGAHATIEDVKAIAKHCLDTNLIGSPDSVAEKLDAFITEFPFMNYVLCICDAGSVPLKKSLRSMELFAKHVMPKFVDRKSSLQRA